MPFKAIKQERPLCLFIVEKKELYTGVIFTLLLPVLALADAEYIPKRNIVKLNTPLMAEGIDSGLIEINSKKHIVVTGFASDRATDKIIGLCNKEPNLGLLILDGKLQMKTAPNVTGVVPFEKSKSKSKSKEDAANAAISAAGFVPSYVLKGDDAQDLIDLLLEYRQVGFAIASDKCPDAENWTSGKIILNFDTRGLERALTRIKKK